MKILVNGKQAVMKEESSFEYHSENPLFTDAEGYSFDIEFPIKDCPQNILIFGALHVKGADISTFSFPCEIIEESFVKTGILTITEVNNAMVKGQFLEGMSSYYTSPELSEIMINQLDFSEYDGSYDGPDSDKRANSLECIEHFGPDGGWNGVPVGFTDSDGVYYHYEKYDSNAPIYRNRQIYLSHLLLLISKVTGWIIDKSALDSIWLFRHTIIMNTRGYKKYVGVQNVGVNPLSWSLPAWSVHELLQQVAAFFGCIVLYDGALRKVKFEKITSFNNDQSMIEVRPLDNFATELAADGESKFKGLLSFKFDEDLNPNGYHDCPWLPASRYYNNRFNPICEMSSEQFLYCIKVAANGGRWSVSDANFPGDVDPNTWEPQLLSQTRLYWLTDIEQYAIITADVVAQDYALTDYHFQRFDIINQYEGLFSGEKELGIVPCMFDRRYVEMGEENYPHPVVGGIHEYMMVPVVPRPEEEEISAPVTKSVIDVIKDKEESPEKFQYDKLFCAIYDGPDIQNYYYSDDYCYVRRYEPVITSINGLPTPIGSYGSVNYYYDKHLNVHQRTFSPLDASVKAASAIYKIDENFLHRFRFLSKTLPDPTKRFLINGKVYACLRITAHFTPTGMSELLEGEFYLIID